MSTKIYNGYKLPFMQYDALMSYLFETKKQFKHVIAGEFARKCANTWADKCDEAFLEGNPITEMDYNFRYDLAKEIKRMSESATREEEDYRIHVSLFPLGDYILCTFYGENKTFVNFWEGLPQVSEYEYYDNSDHPDHLSEADWDRRRQDWDSAIGYDTPADRGLSYNFIRMDDLSWDCPDFKEWGKYLKPLRDRITHRANVTVTDAYFKTCGYLPEDEKGGGCSVWMRHHREMREAPEYLENLEKAKDEWCEKLKDVDYIFTKEPNEY